MYSVIWEQNNFTHSMFTNNWSTALNKYNTLLEDMNIQNPYIVDNESRGTKYQFVFYK